MIDVDELRGNNLYGKLTGNASSANKVNNSLIIKLNGGTTEGTNLFTFDGSAAKSINITPTAVGASASGHTHSYLPLSGGTMTGNITMSGSVLYPHSNSMTQTAPSSTTYYEPIQWLDKDNKRIGAIGTTSYANGDFATHIQVQREINGTNYYQQLYMIINADGTGFCRTTKMYGAVWNDYAEFRICKDNFKPGQVVLENGDDTLSIASQRLQRGCSIVSDTFGFAIGETDEAKCPIAVSGRVLAYGYESREEFKKHIGWPVCSGPNGTVSLMTEEEEEKYPSRIIGTVSAVPDYETWGTGNVKVDGRIWIKVR